MASVLKEVPHWAQQGRRESYPYDSWFDGQVWKLVRGEDFVQPRGQMAHRIRAAAQKRNLRVLVSHTNEEGLYRRDVKKTTEIIIVFALGKKYMADGVERVNPINQRAATYLAEVGAA